LLQGSENTGLWLDRYLDWRTQSLDAPSPSDLDAAYRLAANGKYPAELGAALSRRQQALARLPRLTPAAPSSAPATAELGIHESLYWAERLFEEASGGASSREAAAPYLARAREIDAQNPFLADLEQRIAHAEQDEDE
jgi:hypothetical protein